MCRRRTVREFVKYGCRSLGGTVVECTTPSFFSLADRPPPDRASSRSHHNIFFVWTLPTSTTMNQASLNRSLFVTMNNLGVSLIEEGRYDDAIDCFITAVQHINQVLETTGGFPEQPSSMVCLIQDHHQVLSVPISSNEKMFVFRNPLLVSEKRTGSFQVSAKTSLVALYNLAMGYHLSGLQNQCAKRLKQALSYYELSYKMLLDEQHVVVSQAMIILNNIGQIHRLLQNEEGAKNCFQYLLTTMMFVQQTGEASRIQSWDSFLSNVLDLIIQGPFPASAA
jgi:tetratricopeptide (TPR) repeat protein